MGGVVLGSRSSGGCVCFHAVYFFLMRVASRFPWAGKRNYVFLGEICGSWLMYCFNIGLEALEWRPTSLLSELVDRVRELQNSLQIKVIWFWGLDPYSSYVGVTSSLMPSRIISFKDDQGYISYEPWTTLLWQRFVSTTKQGQCRHSQQQQPS